MMPSAPTLPLAEYLGGVRIPTGDFVVDGDIPNGRSYQVIGQGGGWHGSSSFNGTRFVPARTGQPSILRVAAEPAGAVGINSSLRDFAVIGKTKEGFTAEDGIVMRAWGGCRIENVGFRDLKRGLVLAPDVLRRAVGMTVGGCQFANCDDAIHVDFSRTTTISTLRLINQYITTGVKVGINLVNPFLYRTQICDLYCEGQTVAGVVQHTGDVIYSGGYLEHGSSDEDRDGLVVPIPSIALLGDSVAQLYQMEKVTWLYVARDARFSFDAYTNERVAYLIFEQGDSRIDQYRQPVQGKRFRAHVATQPWSIGNPVEVERVKP